MELKRSLLHSLFVVPHGFGIGRLYDMYFVFYRSLMQGLTLWHSGSRSGAFLHVNEDCCTFSNTEKAADFNILVDFSGFFVLLWRREGDLNPRTGVTRLLVFEASPFSLLGTSPHMVSNNP